MQPLIVASPALDACILVYCALMSVWWCLASARVRAVLAISTIFTFGLRVELGFALDAFRCISVLATGSMLWNFTTRSGQSFRARILWGWAGFILYAIVITAYGTTLIPGEFSGVNNSVFRHSSVRPYINLFTRLTIIPVAWTIFAGLRTGEDLRFFLKGWYYCAIGSALIGAVQLLTYLAGHPLFGILREEGSMPVLPFLGMQFLRICAFTGEPKHMGDIMFVTLILHLTYGKKLNIDQGSRVLQSILPCVMFSLVFSASSGALAALAIYFLTLGFLTPGRGRAISTGLAFLLLLFCGSETFQEIYYLRFERLEELYNHSRVLADGTSNDDRIKDDKEKASMAYAIQNPGSLFFGQGVGVSPYLYNHLVARQHRGKFNEPNNGLMLSLQAVGVVGLVILILGMKKLMLGYYVPRKFLWECQLFTMAVILMMAIHQHFMIFSPVLALNSAIGWSRLRSSVPRMGGNVRTLRINSHPQSRKAAA